MSLGTTIAQIIPVLLSPVLARLFTPAEFGLLAILSSITAVINVISTGKYESVIYIADNKKYAGALVIISLSLSLITSFLIAVLLLFFSDTVIGILKQPRLAHWIFICPLASFLISVYQCYNEWCVRESSFTNLSVNKVVNSGSITLSSLFLGVAKLTQEALILGDLSGRFISAASCTYWALRKDLRVFRQVTWLRINLLLKKYIECPKFVLPGQLLNTLAGQVSVFLIAALFNDTEVGYYSMTGVVLSVPASLISLSIRDVFRQEGK